MPPAPSYPQPLGLSQDSACSWMGPSPWETPSALAGCEGAVPLSRSVWPLVSRTRNTIPSLRPQFRRSPRRS